MAAYTYLYVRAVIKDSVASFDSASSLEDLKVRPTDAQIGYRRYPEHSRMITDLPAGNRRVRSCCKSLSLSLMADVYVRRVLA